MKPLVMVVDDSLVVRLQVRRALVDAGFDVVEAGDGEEALSRIDSHDVSFVICDVNMPRMNGIDFLEGLKSHARGGAIPVVMLTTEGQPDLIRRAQSLGAKGWILKPFKVDHLVAAAKKLVGGAA